VAAPAEVAGPLGLPEGAAVVVRRRVIELDGVPCELTDTYYPVDVARGTPLAGTVKIRGGAVAHLAARGLEPAHVREEVSARLAGPAERAALGLAPGEPVLCLHRVTLDARERPFQVDLTVFPAAGRRLRYELRQG